YLRVFIPEGRLVQEVETVVGPDGMTERPTGRVGLPTAASPVEALQHVHVELLLPDVAAFYTDPATRYEAAVAHIPGTRTNGSLTGETSRTPSVAEVSYPDPDTTVGEGPEAPATPRPATPAGEEGGAPSGRGGE